MNLRPIYYKTLALLSYNNWTLTALLKSRLDRELRSRGHLSPHPRPREVSSGQLRGGQGRQLVGAAQGHLATVQLSNRPPHHLLLFHGLRLADDPGAHVRLRRQAS